MVRGLAKLCEQTVQPLGGFAKIGSRPNANGVWGLILVSGRAELGAEDWEAVHLHPPSGGPVPDRWPPKHGPFSC
eukprot:2195394-Lingulodinium_polyedra.AAC.1